MKAIDLYETLEREFATRNARSAWERGVREYAMEMADFLANDFDLCDVEFNQYNVEAVLLNGAQNWAHYSYSGCALVYDSDIAERLCAPWELKRTRNGERNPNGQETWLDVQARALQQAFNSVRRVLRKYA